MLFREDKFRDGSMGLKEYYYRHKYQPQTRWRDLTPGQLFRFGSPIGYGVCRAEVDMGYTMMDLKIFIHASPESDIDQTVYPITRWKPIGVINVLKRKTKELLT